MRYDSRWARAICVAAIAAGVAVPLAPATASSSYTTDYSDLWWDPDESVWGIQFIQQHRTIFATLYVYSASGQPEFYVAVLSRPDFQSGWGGPAYRTTGPWWGGPFDPASVVESEVGTVSFSPLSGNSGHLDYTIGGVVVNKQILRMSFANDVLAGTYIGAAKYTVASGGCAAGGAAPATAVFSLSAGTTASAALSVGDRNCSAPSVSYMQQGQFARIAGDYACANGEAGALTLTDVKVATDSVVFTWRLVGSGPGYTCQFDGEFAGILQ